MKPSMSQVNADSPISEDQLEVREYLASSRYQRAKSTSWQRERMVANIELGESKSLFMGIGGLATFVLVFGAAMPLGMELVRSGVHQRPAQVCLDDDHFSDAVVSSRRLFRVRDRHAHVLVRLGVSTFCDG